MADRRIAFVSTFPPQRCSIANYTQALVQAITDHQSDLSPMGVAVTDSEPLSYDRTVQFQIRRNKPRDYRRTADALNASGVDLVCIQHEFGIYGGPNQAGEYLSMLLTRLDAPVITTFHSVLEEPSSEQLRMVRTIVRHSEKVVVMAQRAAHMLQRTYGISASKITVIPHGVPKVDLGPTESHKARLGLEGRTVIMTSGLLSSGKGIETVLKALPAMLRSIPNLLYIVLGVTHSRVLSTEGELYRHQLDSLVREFGLERHVIFQDEFVEQQRLCEYLLATDFYVTPYQCVQQVTSGTLAYAVGTGRVVVSTPYWHAAELLSNGAGRVVPFNDTKAIADAIVELYNDPEAYREIRERAYAKSRRMIWPVVGQSYRELFSAVKGGKRFLEFPPTPAYQEKHLSSAV